MSSIKHKVDILCETISTFFRQTKKKIRWKRDSREFKSFGHNSRFEKPYYTRKLQYVSIGEDVVILSGSKIQCDDFFCGVSLSPTLVVGDRTQIGNFFTAYVYDYIEIGNDVILADHVMITSENHGMNPEHVLSYAKQPLETAAVSIGDGCWIGKSVSIMPGVTIGEKVIIGANSVVTHDIPSYSVAAGCPARVLKRWSMEAKCWIKE